MRFQFLGPRTDVAPAEEVRALRERRGWSVEQLADAAHASALEVSAWEAGKVRVPPAQALRIRWMMEVDAWNAALDDARAGCPWVREHAPDLPESMFRDVAGSWYARSAAVREHLAGCAGCRAAWKRAQELGGYPAEPGGDTDSPRGRYDRWVARLPRWARGPFTALAGAGEFALLAFLAFTMPDRDSGLAAHLYGLSMGALVALGTLGLATLAFPRAARRGAGAVLAGIAAASAGLLWWSYADAAIDLGAPYQWAGAVAVGVAMGWCAPAGPAAKPAGRRRHSPPWRSTRHCRRRGWTPAFVPAPPANP